MGGKARAPA